MIVQEHKLMRSACKQTKTKMKYFVAVNLPSICKPTWQESSKYCACLLTARTVKPAETAVAGEQFPVTRRHAREKRRSTGSSVLCAFHVEAVKREPAAITSQVSRVVAGSNTSTVALCVVGATKREPSAWGICIRGPGPPGWGSLESETVRCGHGSRGTRTRE
jgi:hypothetical protein